jgi:ABC-2 type transport system ATP-binding protein
MNNPNGHVIDTRELTKTYKEVNALQGLNLQVPRNSIYGFLGPNGAGKSTTIKILLGLTQPSEGKALVFGRDISRESLAVRRRVGYLAQEPRYYEHMTACQTLRYTARFFYQGPRELLEARLEEILELTGLQNELPGLSKNSLHYTVEGTTHEGLVAKQEHALVVAGTIRQVLESVRTGQPLSEISQAGE